MQRRRRAAPVALLGGVLAAGMLAGCGSSGIPTDASVTDFCAASSGFSSSTKFAEGVKGAQRLRDTGTPKGIPASARQGVEVVVKLVADSRSKADLTKRYARLSAADRKAVAALDRYVTRAC